MGGFAAALGSNHGGWQTGWGDSGGGGFSPSSLGTQVQMWTLDGRTTRTVNGTARLSDKSRSGTARQMQPGRCYNYVGAADSIDAGQGLLDAAAAVTVAAWVNPDVVSGVIAAIWGAQNRLDFHFLSTKLRVVVEPDGTNGVAIQTTNAVSAAAWSHVVVTWVEDANPILYVNGVAVAMDSPVVIGTGLSGPLQATTENLLMGARGESSPTFLYNGKMFDERVFTRALTAVEVAELASMNQGDDSIGAVDALVWYKGDEGGTTITAHDSSGNANDGAITAATIADFHDATSNDQFSFQNEVGYSPGRGYNKTSADAFDGIYLTDQTSGDIYLDFIHQGGSTSTHREYVGLTNESTPTGSNFDLAVYTQSGHIREQGVEVNTDITAAVGDRWRIQRVGTTGSVYHDDTLIYTSGLTLSGGLSAGRLGFDLVDGYGPIATNPVLDTLTVTNGTTFESSYPRDESNTSENINGGPLPYTGQAPRDPVLSSPCVTLDGTADLITVGTTGLSAILLSMKLKMVIDDQEIMSFQNSAATGISVAAATLAFGGSLSMSTVTIDGTSYTSDLAGAGALLNDNAWHSVIIALTAIDASNLVFGTDDSIAFGQVTFADIEVISSVASTICTIPCSEGIGGVAHDVGGFENHGVLTGTESALWAAQQNLTDTMVTDGVAVATRLNAVADYYPKGSRLTTGAVAKFSIGCWVRTTSSATAYMASEWTSTGNQRGWSLSVQSTAGGGKMRFSYTNAGSGAIISRDTATVVNDGKWHHVATVLDSDAGTMVAYFDGVLDNGTLANTPNVSIHDGTAGFGINFVSAVGSAVQMLFGLAIEQDVAWSAGTIAAIYADQAMTPSTAWSFRNGTGKDYNQGLTIALNGAGAVERVPVPQGILPVTVGPGILQPKQSLDLGCGEGASPYAVQLLASALPDLTYDQADDQANAIQFARVLTTDDDGDDRIIVALPALTAGDLTDMQDYTDE